MKKINDEEFFESPLRGVTSVLNAIFGNKYEKSDIPEYILQAAAERGSAVHKYIEDWQTWFISEKKDDIIEPHLGLEYSMYETLFNEFLSDRAEITNVLATEQKILSNHCFMKGILDAVWEVKNKSDDKKYVCLVDIKTSSKLDKQLANMQMQLYYYMLLHGNQEERELAEKITELRILHITKREYGWYKFPIDTDLAEAILYLWNTHFIDIAYTQKKEPNPEQWKWISGYKNKYEISNFGRIRSYMNDKIYYKKPVLNKSGYYTTTLVNEDDTLTMIEVHKLVAVEFIENTDELKTAIRHLDGDITNNYYKNLEWIVPTITIKEKKIKTLKNPRKQIQQFTLDGELINTFLNSAEAGEYLGKKRAPNKPILNCCKGIITSAYGYRWKYLEE